MKRIIYVLISMLPCIVFSQTNHWETAVYEDNIWSYLVPTAEPDTNWRAVSFNAGSWLTGPGGIGYSDGDDNTVLTTCTSIYMRTSFNISDTSKISSALFNADYDDGFIAYLNNVEIARVNVVAGIHPPYNSLATADHEAVMYSGGHPDYFNINQQTLHSIIKPGLNVLAVQVYNTSMSSSDLSSRFWLNFGIRNASVLFGTTPPWFVPPFAFTDSDLPIVIINTGNQVIQDDPKIMADMGIIYNGQGVRNYLTDPYNNYNGKIGLELRGSTSQWIYPKKSYGIETWDVDGNTLDVSLLGMPSENDWVLFSGYADKSLIRNILTFRLWNQMGHYAPRIHPVEVVLNGIYEGVYFLAEKVKRDNNRIDISKMTAADTIGDQLTGGYILKIDKATGSSSNLWNSVYPPANNPGGNPVAIIVHYPSDSDLVSQQLNYIHSYCDSFEIALHGTSFTDPVAGYRHFADEASFVDFFVISEFTKNLDAYRSSCFFYKDKDSKGGKFKMGTLWDYDLSFGNADICDTWLTSGWAYQFNNVCPGDSWEVPFWWDRFMQDSAFVQDVKCRWEYLKSSVFSPTNLNTYIDSLASILNESQQRNYVVWPILGTYVWPNYYISADYQGEVDTLKWWLQQRYNWIDANLHGNPSICQYEGINDMPEMPDGVEIYPNPFNDIIQFALNKPGIGNTTVELINILGQQLQTPVKYSSCGAKQINSFTVDAEIPEGIYFVRISNGISVWVKQLVRQK